MRKGMPEIQRERWTVGRSWDKAQVKAPIPVLATVWTWLDGILQPNPISMTKFLPEVVVLFSKITVDDSGRVVQAVPLEYNVSNEVLAYYRQVVNKVSFKRQGGTSVADFSSGKNHIYYQGRLNP